MALIIIYGWNVIAPSRDCILIARRAAARVGYFIYLIMRFVANKVVQPELVDSVR